MALYGPQHEGLQKFNVLINGLQPSRAEKTGFIGVSDCRGPCRIQKNCQKEWACITSGQLQHTQLLHLTPLTAKCFIGKRS